MRHALVWPWQGPAGRVSHEDMPPPLSAESASDLGRSQTWLCRRPIPLTRVGGGSVADGCTQCPQNTRERERERRKRRRQPQQDRRRPPLGERRASDVTAAPGTQPPSVGGRARCPQGHAACDGLRVVQQRPSLFHLGESAQAKAAQRPCPAETRPTRIPQNGRTRGAASRRERRAPLPTVHRRGPTHITRGPRGRFSSHRLSAPHSPLSFHTVNVHAQHQVCVGRGIKSRRDAAALPRFPWRCHSPPRTAQAQRPRVHAT